MTYVEVNKIELKGVGCFMKKREKNENVYIALRFISIV